MSDRDIQKLRWGAIWYLVGLAFYLFAIYEWILG